MTDVHTLGQQIVLQVLETLHVVVESPGLAVRHEYHAVGALKHQLPGRVVVTLTRDRVELELGGEAGDRAQLEGKEIEEQGPVGLSGKGPHTSAAGFGNPPVDVLQVGR